MPTAGHRPAIVRAVTGVIVAAQRIQAATVSMALIGRKIRRAGAMPEVGGMRAAGAALTVVLHAIIQGMAEGSPV